MKFELLGFWRLFFFFFYPTNSCLHDGIEAGLQQVDIGRNALWCDYLVELVRAARQRQDVLVAKCWQAGRCDTTVDKYMKNTIRFGQFSSSCGNLASVEIYDFTETPELF